jgi:ATP-binding cassette, subfamily B, heavy metal transporter
VSWIQARWLQSDREHLDVRRNRLNSSSDEVLSKRDLILAYERDRHYQTRLLTDADEYGRLEQKLAWHEELFRGFTGVLFDLGRILILLIAFVVAFTRDSEAISDIGDAYFLLALYWRMVTPANNLRIGFDEMRRARSTSQSFLRLLAESRHDHVARADLGEPDPTTDPAIQFDDVHFGYEEADGRVRPVLVGSSFKVPAKKTTLLVGRSGSGKTTIARILLGFLEPDEGRITVEGREIAGWTARDLRLRMSYISQGDHIVDDTIRANFLTDEVDDEVMDATLLRVGVQAGDLDAAAKNLSIGQQQRVALARMLADSSDIVIMDEPLAGLDAFTFRDVSAELAKLLTSRERTILMVSHRLSFAAYADHVIVLGDEGRVVEEGSREELLRRGGQFHALHSAALLELERS